MKTIVGLFDTFVQAERAVRDLQLAGYGRDTVSVVASEASRAGRHGGPGTAGNERVTVAEGRDVDATQSGVTRSASELIAALAPVNLPDLGPVLAAGPLTDAAGGAGGTAVSGRAGGLAAALSAAGVPRAHAAAYAEGVRGGGTLVTVAGHDEDADEVIRVLNRHNPVDIETRGGAETTGDAAAFLSAPGRTGRGATPAVAENAFAAGAFKEQTIELTETVEQAVVEKRARVVEEIVIGKEAGERVETVRDTVRRTEVDVEQVGADRAAATSAGASAMTSTSTSAASDAAGSDFDHYDADFRSNFQNAFPGAQHSYDEAKPAYRYGYSLGGQRRTEEWSAVEPEARRDWEQRNPGTWDKFKDAARYAYDRARNKVSS